MLVGVPVGKGSGVGDEGIGVSVGCEVGIGGVVGVMLGSGGGVLVQVGGGVVSVGKITRVSVGINGVLVG